MMVGFFNFNYSGGLTLRGDARKLKMQPTHFGNGDDSSVTLHGSRNR